MRTTRLIPCTVVIVLAAATANAATVLYLDCSSSMKGQKARIAKEASKLAVMTLDESQQLTVVGFNSQAAASPVFSMSSRDAAIRWVDGLPIDGGTDYLSAMKATSIDKNSTGIFISDGEHNGPPEPVLDFIDRHLKGKQKLYTIAVECGKNSPAERLLAQMAARTGGSFVRVERSEELVKALVDIAVSVGKYSSHTPSQNHVQFGAIPGRILGFAFDGIPQITVSSAQPQSVLRHHAALPSEDVDLAAVRLTQPSLVELKLQGGHSSRARLGDVHVSGLPVGELSINAPSGRLATDSRLTAQVRFTDPQNPGSVLDPKVHPELGAEVQMLDGSGRIVERAQAQPDPASPVLKADLKVPDQPGAITVVGKSTVTTNEGLTFVHNDRQTVLVTRPHKLAVSPARLDESVKVGPFQSRLAVSIPQAPTKSATYAATLNTTIDGLRLLRSTSKDDALLLDFIATRAGQFRGTLRIHANASVLTNEVELPFSFTVKPKFKGLRLPLTRNYNLGTTLAGTGLRQAVFTIPSLDGEPVDYVVEVADLAGDASLIPVSVDQPVLRPTNNAAGKLKLSADVGAVPAGLYCGVLTIKPMDTADTRAWKTRLELTVSEPLAASPVDAGAIEVGKIVTRSVTVENLSDNPVTSLDVKAPTRFSGDAGNVNDIVISVLKTPSVILPRQKSEVLIRIAVSPLIEARGKVTGTLRILRDQTLAATIPLSLILIDSGSGPAALSATPNKLRLKAAAGGVAKFTMRVKLLSKDVDRDELEITAGPFRDAWQTAVASTADFQWPDGKALSRSTPVRIEGFLIAPEGSGSYRTTLTVRSQHAGNIIVPLTLDIP